MKAKCIFNTGNRLPPRLVDENLGLGLTKQFSIIVGKEYTVYGMTVFLGYIWYYICDETYTHYPVWHPAPLFELTDSRLSKFWRLGYHQTTDGVSLPVFAFDEWANDPFFYDGLTDGDVGMIAIFNKRKEQIDIECLG